MPPVRYQDYRAYLTEIEINEEELTYNEAMKNGWEDAINDEIKNILENKTWETVEDNDQPRTNAVWKFKTKTNGRRIKKARLVARGCKQNKNEGIYTHVPSSTAINIFLVITANRRLKMEQMDIKAAYLNSYLKEHIYMTVPKEFPTEGTLCKLRKAIYGLRQASQAWIAEFESFMKDNGFVNSEVDTCLYRKNKSEEKKTVYVLNYVDDILISSSSNADIKEFKFKLIQRYTIKEITQVRRFIGLEINQTDNYITISQTDHIRKLLKTSELEMANPRRIPMEPNTKYVNSADNYSASETFKTKYRRLIGNLLYISQHTRPNITYGVNYLSRIHIVERSHKGRTLKRYVNSLI